MAVRRILKRGVIQPALVAFAVLALGALLLLFIADDMPHSLDHWTADLRTTHLSRSAATQDKDILLFEITNECLDGRAYTTPIDRKLLADIVSKIDSFGPRAIALDIILDRPTEREKDLRLMEVLSQVRAPLVLGVLRTNELSATEIEFRDAALKTTAPRSLGHLYFDTNTENPLLVSEDVVRRIAPRLEGVTAKSLAEAVVSLTGKPATVEPGQTIRWLLSPDDGTDWFSTISCGVLSLPEAAARLKSMISDHVVLIGANFPDRDRHLIPLSVWSDRRFTGAFIHAQIIRQILDGASVHVFDRPWMQVLFFILFVPVGYLSAKRDKAGLWEIRGELFCVGALIALSALLFWVFQVILPFLACFLGWYLTLRLTYFVRHWRSHTHKSGGHNAHSLHRPDRGPVPEHGRRRRTR